MKKEVISATEAYPTSPNYEDREKQVFQEEDLVKVGPAYITQDAYEVQKEFLGKVFRVIKSLGHGEYKIGNIEKEEDVYYMNVTRLSPVDEKEERRKKHREKYAALCYKYGVKWFEDSPRLVGETLESIIEKFKEDPVLNNVPLAKWDSIAFSCAIQIDSRLSLSEGVCMQKEAAIQLIEGSMRK